MTVTGTGLHSGFHRRLIAGFHEVLHSEVNGNGDRQTCRVKGNQHGITKPLGCHRRCDSCITGRLHRDGIVGIGLLRSAVHFGYCTGRRGDITQCAYGVGEYFPFAFAAVLKGRIYPSELAILRTATEDKQLIHTYAIVRLLTVIDQH